MKINYSILYTNLQQKMLQAEGKQTLWKSNWNKISNHKIMNSKSVFSRGT